MFDLNSFLPYLINRTGVRVAGAFSDAIQPYGITLQMWRVLAALHHQDGQRMTELAETTSIDVSTLSRLVGSIERKGLAERQRGAGGADARVVTVHATEAGRNLTERLIPLAQHYEAVALAGLSPEDEAALKALLVRVYENLEGLEPESDSDTPADAA